VNVPSPESLAGGSDKEAFGDLWDEFEFVCDLPIRWRFELDEARLGEQRGFHRPDFRDWDWPRIRIRDFWEAQGYAPYDGPAWYRVRLVPPALGSGRRLYLAFGGVSDGTQVYVNGEKLPISADGWRPPRFLVEVTGALREGEGNLIAVRVLDMGWVGGIYGNIKLVARR